MAVLAQQPFREDNQPSTTLVFLPDEDEATLVTHRIEDKLEKAGQSPYVEAACYDIPLGHPPALYRGA